MKKHPVDDLFAKKLDSWERKPSKDLWKRIEARQKTKTRRMAAWYWYAAAGVVLTIAAGYLVWQSEAPSQMDTSNTLAKQEIILPKSEPRESLAVLPEKKPELEAKQELVSDATGKHMSQLPVNSGDSQTEIKQNLDSEPVEAVEIQVATTTKPLEVATEPPMTEKPSIASLQPTTDGTSKENLENPEIGTPKRVVIARVQTEMPVNEDEAKSSKFIRILKQLKNAKEGESVDWKEVGVNPRKMIARADARLKNEEEKVSKYYQNLKEKANL
ncbi:hypothetical protein [Arundinibacter roseus]|uniref:Uncharacterized protein n=1 Tax=Arundinibacter roseus TaxID=2070510 RepID=A0A4R4K7T8_9BACT|nr:hypothetical protein [Arundinibacter roseus]TDB63658.1 hypothetical protein EZE20_15275 [Arundinibacter roseus]